MCSYCMLPRHVYSSFCIKRSGSMVTEIRCSCHIGHSKAVTGLAMSQDNSTLVSSSCDGSLRVWNVWTRQCLRESKPLHKAAISNMLVRIHTNISCLVDSILSMRCMYVCMYLWVCIINVHVCMHITIFASCDHLFIHSCLYPYVHLHFYCAQ